MYLKGDVPRARHPHFLRIVEIISDVIIELSIPQSYEATRDHCYSLTKQTRLALVMCYSR